MPAERDSGISIAERISHQLRDDIMEGKLPPGTQLVEVDLAADSVSYTHLTLPTICSV